METDLTPAPHDLLAETAVLGAAMADDGAARVAVDSLTEHDFFARCNALTFRSLAALIESGRRVDVAVLHDHMRTEGFADEVGGLDFLASLIGGPVEIEEHVRIVREMAVLRRLAAAAEETRRDVLNRAGRGADELVTMAEDRLARVGRGRRGGYHRVKDTVWGVLDAIEEGQESDRRGMGLATGVKSLDAMTYGLHPGEMTLIAARPSMGKTALALKLLRHASIRQAVPSLVISLEMERTKLVHRMLAAESGVPMDALRGGRKMESEQVQRLATAASAVHGAPILVDDSYDEDLSSIIARARTAHMREGVGLIVVDYVQLMTADGEENRNTELTKISRRLKKLANTLRVPIVVLSQLSRGPEGRKDKRPMLSDLRESGALEQDADNVVMMYRPEYYMPPGKTVNDSVVGLTELLVLKQRNGETGTAKAWIHKATSEFYDEPVKGNWRIAV